MEIINKLSKSFFEKERPIASNDSLKNVIPFIFTNNEEVKKGKYKDKKIISLPVNKK